MEKKKALTGNYSEGAAGERPISFKEGENAAQTRRDRVN